MEQIEQQLSLLEEDNIRKEETVKEHQQFALDNDFIRMPNRLSAPALKVFYLLLSKIEWNKINPKNELGLIEVNTSIREIQKAIGTESHNYRYYINFLDELQMKAWIKIDKDMYYRKTLIMPDVEVINNQSINITLNKSIYGFLEHLYRNFTVFELSNTSQFQSRFALILYINLCSHMDHSRSRKDPVSETEWRYTTRQLKEMFDLDKDDYCTKKGNFHRSSFEREVINRAVNEINEKPCGIRVEWTKEKNGKFVKNYIFRYFRTDVWEIYNKELGISEGWSY